jgi:photosystem II stability/assembly factor-like uncharacterized protein
MKKIYRNILFIIFALSACSDVSITQWFSVNGSDMSTLNVYSLAFRSSGFGKGCLFAGAEGRVFRSTDSGITWTFSNQGISNSYVYALLADSSGRFKMNVLASVMYNGLFLSVNNGDNWTFIDSIKKSNFVHSLSCVTYSTGKTVLFAGTTGDGLSRSTDDGAHWSLINNSWPINYTYSFAVFPTEVDTPNLFIGTEYGIYKSTDLGSNWIESSTAVRLRVTSLTKSGRYLFAGTSTFGIFMSSDSGRHWLSVNNGIPWIVNNLGQQVRPTVNTLIANDSYVIAALYAQGVYITLDNGMTWKSANAGLPNLYVTSLVTDGERVFAGTSCAIDDFGTPGNGIWCRSLSDFTSVKKDIYCFPNKYELYQNYPNPFNPSTTMSYTIPVKSFITLKVYNILGEKITTIYSGNRERGTFTQTWNATSQSSGIYFCRLTAGNYMASKKMFLIK